MSAPTSLGDDERETAAAEELLQAMETYQPIVSTPPARAPSPVSTACACDLIAVRALRWRRSRTP